MKRIIETERLIIRELEIEDVSSLAKILCDKDSMKYYPRPKTLEEVVSWIERNIDRYRKNGFGLWAVIRKVDSEFLGDCGLTLQNIDSEELPEVGYHIIKEYCQNGYASEAARACLGYGFGKFNFDAIFSYTSEMNRPSIKVMENIGMKKVKDYINNGTKTVAYKLERDA